MCPPEEPKDSGTLEGVSMISSWVGVPAPSSLTGVPSTPSGLTSPRARLKPGLPCKKLLILDSKLGGETVGAEGRGGGGGGGGGGGDCSLSFSQLLLLPGGVSRLKLFSTVGLFFGVFGVSGVFTLVASGEVREEGAAEVFVTLCKREDKAVPRQNGRKLFIKKYTFKKKITHRDHFKPNLVCWF